MFLVLSVETKNNIFKWFKQKIGRRRGNRTHEPGMIKSVVFKTKAEVFWDKTETAGSQIHRETSLQFGSKRSVVIQNEHVDRRADR